MDKKKFKFLLFSFGMAFSIASICASILILILNIFGFPSIIYEPNIILAIIEIIMLIIAAATCFLATEIYHEYLNTS